MYSQYTDPLPEMSWENYVHTNKQKAEKVTNHAKAKVYMLQYLLNIRSASFRTKSVILHVASERRFCCQGFFSFPQVMGDLFAFTRSTDGPEIHSDVPFRCASPLKHSLRAASSTGAHCDLWDVSDRVVFPESRQGQCWRTSSEATWHRGTP